MDYEKKYKEALEQAKAIYQGNLQHRDTDIIEKEYHLWTIQDAKDGDVLFHSDSASNGIFIFKELLKYEFGEKVICYCDYDSEDGFCLGEYHTCCWADAKILHPATKEQQDLLFSKMKEAGYEWDAEKKELKKIEQKPNYCYHEVDLSGCSEEYRKAYYDGWNNCALQWQHWLDDNHINVGERFDYQHATIINKDFAPKVDLGKESELIANGIMISVQANKYGTNIYNTERNDFNHHHLQMAAREGIELGLKAQKE